MLQRVVKALTAFWYHRILRRKTPEEEQFNNAVLKMSRFRLRKMLSQAHVPASVIREQEAERAPEMARLLMEKYEGGKIRIPGMDTGEGSESKAMELLKKHLGPAEFADSISRAAKLIEDGEELAKKDPTGFMNRLAETLQELRDYKEYTALMAREGEVEAEANGQPRLAAVFALIRTNDHWRSFLEQMRGNTTDGG